VLSARAHERASRSWAVKEQHICRRC
jgi:hypothetical protein